MSNEHAEFLRGMAKAMSFNDTLGIFNGRIDKLLAAAVEIERLKAAEKFAGAVLSTHRNDGYPSDIDGGTLQGLAVEYGMTELVTVSKPCGEQCSCAEVLPESEFPTECYLNTEAGKAAMRSTDGEMKNG